MDSIKKIKESKTNIYYYEYEMKRFEVFKKELTLRGLLLEKSTINTLDEKEELRLLRQEINKLKSKENDLLKAIYKKGDKEFIKENKNDIANAVSKIKINNS